MQGFNMGRYRPPTADPRTTPFNATHPLGARARRLHTHGILVVRFEIPFNVFCLSCSTHLSQGLRFNAEKQQAGEYLSTKIWSFAVKCPSCSGRIEIRTDPKNAQYVVESGARKQQQDWDPEEYGGFAVYDSKKGEEIEPKDAFDRLDKEKAETRLAEQRQKRVQELQHVAERRGSDPYAANSRLRSDFRKDKRKRVGQLEKDIQLKERIGWRDDTMLAEELTPTLTPTAAHREKALWNQASTSRRKLRSKSENPAERLKASLVAATLKKKDPFWKEIAATKGAEGDASKASKRA
ncbi:hypothetical protein PHSY_003412 [Pseudozyma hubeiensis SY62]|uniref:Uncharacterized protein n=1 Tax=Pseudozyma hubeiensis (strain SY62) TaxID=1305764 RepID=R9PCQ9_PSEHS|nr:hypothetical protein PHSY_003412 [Pseudozyma hubeiensis SY62]GAC95835.1 hypothetical protein PHSY_003412 [Pseudozyma hubeiensis SY62]